MPKIKLNLKIRFVVVNVATELCTSVEPKDVTNLIKLINY